MEISSPPAETARTQAPGPIAPRGERAALISQSLKTIARRARTPRNILVSSGSSPERRWQRLFGWAIVVAFAIVVFVPNLVAGVYLAFVASGQYATEARFAVRGGEPSLLDQFGGLAGLQSAQSVQNSMILTDYIDGRSMVAAVDQALNLRRIFARDHVDFFSRFNPKSSDEELQYYWRRHIDVKIDSMSGIITVVVRAFTPQDSFDITQKVIALSEQLVNDLSKRSRADALRQAQAELGRARQNLQEKVAALRDLRNAEGIIDSGKTSEVMTKMLGDLRLELIHMQQDYSAQGRTVSDDAPQMRVMKARIDSMKDQIRQLDDQMVSADDKAHRPLSKAMGRLDVAQLEKGIAENQYVAAAAEYERARIELETQNMYLASFLKPIMAQEALYPKRLWLWSIVAFVTLLLWGGGVGAAVMVRNHIAV